MHSSGAVARMQVEDDRCISGVFYMSADMRRHLERNGQVMVMDTTFKTNQFHWPLLLVCGVDEHYHTVLFAVAILHHQTTVAFAWALDQVKSSVSSEVWGQVASVFTDGDAAMSAALANVAPHARHLRCRYHLENNLRSNLHGKLGVVAMEEFIAAWKEVINAEGEAVFDQERAKLHHKYPAAVSYMEKNHWPHARQFVECYSTDVITFGIRSTARVESWNALLKGALQVNSTTALPILFQALQFAASEVDRRRLKAAVAEAARLPSLPRARTFAEEVSPHLTYWAKQKTQLQFDLQHNYQLEQKTVAGSDSVWYVWDKRPASSSIAREERREVTAKDDYMHCSCKLPTSHLLPCRHVLHLNLYLFRVAFRSAQVGKRWLKYYKPNLDTDASTSPEDEARFPSFNTSVHLPAAMPARSARYGQLMGYCMTVCTRAAEFTAIFHTTLTKVEELAAWVENMTARAVPSPPACRRCLSPSVAAAAPAAATSALHPDVDVGQLTFPSHRKKQPGREGQRRQVNAGEKRKLTAMKER